MKMMNKVWCAGAVGGTVRWYGGSRLCLWRRSLLEEVEQPDPDFGPVMEEDAVTVTDEETLVP